MITRDSLEYVSPGRVWRCWSEITNMPSGVPGKGSSMVVHRLMGGRHHAYLLPDKPLEQSLELPAKTRREVRESGCALCSSQHQVQQLRGSPASSSPASPLNTDHRPTTIVLDCFPFYDLNKTTIPCLSTLCQAQSLLLLSIYYVRHHWIPYTKFAKSDLDPAAVSKTTRNDLHQILSG
jgi:hypothetical protein